tara:strand:- start:925 stop:1380 length:456 start_codon:yes stop_codon:yes gene_type:complete
VDKPATAAEYLDALSPERKEAVERLMTIIRAHLPDGYQEIMNSGMPSWVVPHSRYEAGYHVNPEQPLPFLGLASQKSHIALYHMGIYASPSLMEWFVEAYPKHSKTKLNMGKSCIRFKSLANIPYDLIGQLCAKMSAQQWIDIYEAHVRRG